MGSAAGDAAENARFFKARLMATVHEYGEAGLPVDSLRRKFAQVPRQPTPKPQPQQQRSPQPDPNPNPNRCGVAMRCRLPRPSDCPRARR